ncbi:hypothetical protein PV733_40690 [Streptomyces europaeiscabiei]|uniref:hypothetical protein n=1 Tax=Streptomyces europaeiscabiei TaxID=146819 RepID=UPI0029BC860E|nr:hypothetical protein [Streptomyces europaeiscabiei]MDX3715138.1 hypothetical protein [Streptomyces europaeiscabiei]
MRPREGLTAGSNATRPWRARRAVGLRLRVGVGVGGQETNKARVVDLDLDLDLACLGIGPDPWGGPRPAFRATVELPRADFAMNYNQIVQASWWLSRMSTPSWLRYSVISGGVRRLRRAGRRQAARHRLPRYRRPRRHSEVAARARPRPEPAVQMKAA